MMVPVPSCLCDDLYIYRAIVSWPTLLYEYLYRCCTASEAPLAKEICVGDDCDLSPSSFSSSPLVPGPCKLSGLPLNGAYNNERWVCAVNS